MKDKISTIILLAIFIALLVIIYNLTSSQAPQSNISENLVNTNSDTVDGTVSEEEENEMEVMSVTNATFEKEVLESDKKVLIDFYADWCGPCKMLSPIVAEFAKENEDVKVVKINIDENQEIAVSYGVMSIPTLVVVENGETKNTSVGLISKSEIEELVK